MTRRSGHCTISDALKSTSHMVNIYNDSPMEEDQGWEMLNMLGDAVERIQELPPLLFTEDEIGWVSELAEQLIEIESCKDEDDDINNWKINDNFPYNSRNNDDDKENNS